MSYIGPTASGKSDLGIKLAKKFKGDIISADSRQVYRGMDIGTGKVLRDKTLPNSKFKILNLKLKNNFYSSGVKHHLLDVANPKKVFTVSDFKKLGEKSIKNIFNKNKIPFTVGGTGFYIDALVKDFALPEVLPNKKLRAKLEKISAENLYKKLKKLDIKRAQTIDKHNKRRLIRALEIIKTTGKPIPELKELAQYEVLYLGINPPKNILEKRIRLRLNKRLKQGMVKEVKDLLKNGVSNKRLKDLGLEYGWISRYLNKEIGHKEMREGLFRDIIKYSKRQMTWFKRNKDIHWLNPPAGGQNEAEKLIKKFISPLL